MAEKCPVGITAEDFNADSKGFIWDTGIPDECWACIHTALAGPAANTEFFKPEIFEGEIEEGLDKYLATGIKGVDEGPSRIAMQEFGIEGSGANEGNLYSRTMAKFDCQS